MRPPGAIRRLFKRWSRDKTVRRRLDDRVGGHPLIVSPDAALAYLRPGPIVSTLTWLAARFIGPGDQVWDLGANVGVFSFAAAARGGSVLAVEPDPFLAGLLRRSARLQENRELDVEVLSVAMSSRFDLATFAIAERGRASNSLLEVRSRVTAGGVRDRLTVPLLTLDMLASVRTPPSFLKIDVEGAELDVLTGGRVVLEERRPLVYLEVGREDQEEAGRRLGLAGYRLFTVKGSSASDEIVEVPTCGFDTLAIPEEKVEAVIASVAEAHPD